MSTEAHRLDGFDSSPQLEEALRKRFKRIVIFSGAGMSAESGIPTFRSGSNGLWSQFNPADLANLKAWRRDPPLVWGWYEWRRGLVMQAQPHAGHRAAAELQQRLGATLVTQNVDDLHERAGAAGVLHLHGSLFAPRCDICGTAHEFPYAPPDQPLLEIEPPPCSRCSGRLRPGVVWFGEQLPQDIVAQAVQAIQACDLLLIVGTSGVVQPAAGLVDLAPEDATIMEINPEPSARRRAALLQVRGTAAGVLPGMRDALLSARE